MHKLMPRQEIERIVARFKSGKDIPEKIKPVFVSESIHQPDQNSDESKTTEDAKAPVSCPAPDNFTRKYSGKSTTAGGGRKFTTDNRIPQPTPILKKKYKLEFALSINPILCLANPGPESEAIPPKFRDNLMNSFANHSLISCSVRRDNLFRTGSGCG